MDVCRLLGLLVGLEAEADDGDRRKILFVYGFFAIFIEGLLSLIFA